MPSNRGYAQETFLGLMLHKLSKGKKLRYREQLDDYEPPARFAPGYKTAQKTEEGEASADQQSQQQQQSKQPQRTSSSGSEETAVGGSSSPKRKGSENASSEKQQQQQHGEKDALEGPPRSLAECEGDPYLVDWDSPSDSDNPQNWPLWKKFATLGLLCLLTTSVYMGSAIYTPGIPLLAEYFSVGVVTATLGLTLFVFGYGLGPMIGLSAMSEIPAIGRTLPYIVTLAIFVILQVPQALVNNIAGFMIIRFLSGLAGSPPLATGGASISEVFSPKKRALGLGAWGLSAVMGPALGPLIGGYASRSLDGVQGWRWTIWPLLFLSGFSLIILTLFLPETSANNILLRRAQRLRTRTGNPHLRSKGELIAQELTGKEIALMTFVRPFTLSFGEPIVLGINLHIGLVYGILYLWFEAFPLVFTETYGFSPGETGLAFLGILISAVLAFGLFWVWHAWRYEPLYDKHDGKLEPELWLEPAMFGAWCIPICLFGFGWTATRSVPWIVPIIFSVFSIGTFCIFQSGLSLLAQAYENYVASVFAGNDFFRASIGAALPLVARALFNNLQANGPRAFPVAWGCTLMGCISIVMVPIPYLLHRYGPYLRRVSKYATSPGEAAKVM